MPPACGRRRPHRATTANESARCTSWPRLPNPPNRWCVTSSHWQWPASELESTAAPSPSSSSARRERGGDADRPIITSIKEYPEGPKHHRHSDSDLEWRTVQRIRRRPGRQPRPGSASSERPPSGPWKRFSGGGPPLALDAVAATSVGVRPVVVAQVVSMRGVDEEVAVGSALDPGRRG